MSDNTQPILCEKAETEHRISICILCENNVVDVVPKCKGCNDSLSMLTSFKDKTCPIGKW